MTLEELLARESIRHTMAGYDHGGCYIDRFRKVGECWLIAHRKMRLDWRSPDSLFQSVVAETRQ